MSVFACPEADEEKEDLREYYQGMLSSIGVEGELRKEVANSAFVLEEEGKAKGMRRFLEHENEEVSFFSVMLLAVHEPASLRRRLTRLLKEDGLKKSYLVGLAIVAKTESVDWMIERLADEKDEEGVRNLQIGLRIVSGKNHGEVDAWKGWWAENRGVLKIRPLREVEQINARIQFAGLGAMGDQISNLFTETDDEVMRKLGDALGDVFAQMEKMQELGLERESSWIEDGDRFFRQGRLGDARDAYLGAIRAGEGNLKCRFLVACLAFENEQWDEALRRFKAFQVEHPTSVVAPFLAKLCRERAGGSKGGVRLEEIEWDSQALLEDPLMSRVTGQSMVQRGVMSVGLDTLEQVMMDHPKDVGLRLGVVFMLPKKVRGPLIDSLIKDFPNDHRVIAAYVGKSQRSLSEEEKEMLVKVCGDWARIEEGNLLPHLFLACLIHADKVGKNEQGEFVRDPFPQEVWDDLIKRSRSQEFNWPDREIVKAQVKIARHLGYPFEFPTEGLTEPFGLFGSIMDCLKWKLGHSLRNGQDVSGLLKLRDRLIARPASRAFIGIRMHEGRCSVLEEVVQRRGVVLNWVEMTPAQREAQSVKSEERRKAGKPVERMAILMAIPIPKLRNELGQRLWGLDEDE